MQSQTTHLQGRSWLWEPDLPGPAAFSSMGMTVDTVRPLAEEKIPIRKASCTRAQVSISASAAETAEMAVNSSGNSLLLPGHQGLQASAILQHGQDILRLQQQSPLSPHTTI